MSTIPTILSTIALALPIVACSGAAETLRPAELTSTDALGTGDGCENNIVPTDSAPLIVHWDDEERAALESAMARGVALVRYECSGIQVLRGCSVVGDYEYQGTSAKTRQVSMKDEAALNANLGLSVKFLKGAKANFRAGRSLELAYRLVGTRTTAVSSVNALQLKGRCDGATHFVHGVSLGAFAMTTSAEAKTQAAAEIFGKGGEVNASTTTSTGASDGELASCDTATAEDAEPRVGCQALLHATLFAVDATASAGRDGRTCPENFSYDEGACVPTKTVTTEPCAADAPPADCIAGCEANNLISCGRLAAAYNPLLVSKSVVKAEKSQMLDTYQGVVAQLSNACVDGEASTCTAIAFAQFRNLRGPEKVANQSDGLKYAIWGCVEGDAHGCSMVRQAFLTSAGGLIGMKTENAERFTQVMSQGCARGSALPCGLLGELYAAGLKVPANLDVATGYSSRGCSGGDRDSCVLAGALASSKERCAALTSNLVPRSHKAKEQESVAAGVQSLCGKATNEAVAKQQLAHACSLGAKAACE